MNENAARPLCHILLSLIASYSLSPSIIQAGEPAADAAAVAALENARKEFDQAHFDASADRFRDFLKNYAQHKDAPAAQFGLALSLLEKPQKDYNAALTALQQIAGKNDFSDGALALYYLGSIQKTFGLQALEQAAAKPNEAENLRKSANEKFDEALKNFAAAADAFSAKLKEKDAPENQEWRARSVCEQSDILLRQEKFKEAAALASTLANDKALEKSPFRQLALYHLACANFTTKDYFAAGRALIQLAPFQQEFGLHARFMLSRIHQLSGERPEALANYKAVLAEYDSQKAAATEAMKNPGALKPEDRTRFETLLRTPAPDFIIRATFYYGLLLAEDARFGEALDVLNGFLQKYPKSPLADEARLRLGYCQLQVKNPEAAKTLQPLHNHAQLADRALWWTARAQATLADANNAQAFENAMKSAIELLKKANEKAAELGKNDAEAKSRCADILIDLADTQLAARQYKESAETYAKVITEFPKTDRAEEALQRQANALHLAGNYKDSDELCQKFEQAYPKSVLIPLVWFCEAENASLDATAAAKEQKDGDRKALNAKFEEAIKRYGRILEKFPEFQYVNLAKYGMASAQFQLGKYADAIATLSTILDADRNGDLAGANYLQADSLTRLLPDQIDNALQAAQMIDRADQGTKLLDKYVPAQGKNPIVADALLKMGYCQQRIGILLIDPMQRQQTLSRARGLFEKVMQEFGNTPAMPTAVMERARTIAMLGDIGGAINELNRFTGDPLKQSAIAPLALVREASLMRSQNRFNDAVNLMANCRAQHEVACQKDPARAEWVALIQIEHGLALKDAGKLAEARAIFAAVAKQFEKAPEAFEALWRAAQCRREEIAVSMSAARVAVFKPGAKPEETAAAQKTIDEGISALKQTADLLKVESEKLKPVAGANVPEAYLRMLYESAWLHRMLADAEVENARQRLQSQALEKILNNYKKAMPNQPPPALVPGDVSSSNLPQVSTKAAQECYEKIIATAPASALGARARIELSEFLLQQGQTDDALEMLACALEDAPPTELNERIHLRIAACLLAKDDVKGALAQTQSVLKNQKSPSLGEAFYLNGEIYMHGKDWNNAINHLANFRDRDPYRNMGALTERALFRLAQAFAEAKRWDESRQAFEQVVNRFPQSPRVFEARFGMGWAFQNMNQHDNACNQYVEIVRRSASEIAAKAQLQIGLCRLAQKRFPEAAKELNAVSAIYDYPEHNAAALCESGQALLEQQKKDEAAKLWEVVIKDYAKTKWAETAKERLGKIK